MKKIFFLIGLAAIAVIGCKEKVAPVDGNYATVTFANSGAKFITDDIEVAPGDSLNFDFTITSNRDMRYVSVQKNPVNHTAFLVRDTISAANKNSYSAIKRFKADTANGAYLYRISALDKDGVYIGSRDIKVTVTTDFNYYTNRFIQVPDTVAKTNQTYFSARSGKTYSYTTGATASADIDFGFYFDTTGVGTVATADDVKFSLYALTAPQNQLAYYDISGFTKNATIMKKATSPSFTSLTSAGGLRAAANTVLASGTSSKVSLLSNASPNNQVFFRTASGKAGCLLITFSSAQSAAKDAYITVDIKIEK